MRFRALDFIEVFKNTEMKKLLKEFPFTFEKVKLSHYLVVMVLEKTTALNILTGFLAPDEGRVLINGKDLSEDVNKLRKNMGYLTSDTALYERFSVLESIEFVMRLGT